ncbi:hypothetical protein LXL04_019259 [Taraxacum kok-saghyz]
MISLLLDEVPNCLPNHLLGGFDTSHSTARGNDADINFDLSDYKEDMTQFNINGVSQKDRPCNKEAIRDQGNKPNSENEKSVIVKHTT